MPVGAQQVERGAGNLRARQFHVVDRISGNGVDLQQVAEIERISGRRRLPDHDQGKSRVIEYLEQIFDRAVRPELEPQPSEHRCPLKSPFILMKAR